MICRIVMGFVLAAASGCGASQASYLSDSIPASNVRQHRKHSVSVAKARCKRQPLQVGYHVPW